MTHDLLDNAGLNALLNQVRAGGVPAAVRSQLPGTDALQRGIVFLVEIVLVDVDQLVSGRGVHQIFQNREDGICQNNGCSLSDIGFQTGADDLPRVPADVLLFGLQQFAGHHASVDHQENVSGEPVAVSVVVPHGGQLFSIEGRALGCFGRWELQELGHVDRHGLVGHGVLVEVRQDHLHVAGRVEG